MSTYRIIEHPGVIPWYGLHEVYEDEGQTVCSSHILAGDSIHHVLKQLRQMIEDVKAGPVLKEAMIPALVCENAA